LSDHHAGVAGDFDGTARGIEWDSFWSRKIEMKRRTPVNRFRFISAEIVEPTEELSFDVTEIVIFTTRQRFFKAIRI
jgi:hypothetical protein